MKTDIEITVQQFLQREKLEDKRILLLLSGGVDSVTLFHVLLKTVKATNLFGLYVNHQARKAVKQEQGFVENLCKKNNVKLFCKTIDIQPQKNRENFWRQQRLAFATQIQKKYQISRVLTAHHATDLVETVIFRMAKGVGISGLCPFDLSSKPLFEISKKEIYLYAKQNNLLWAEDESNKDLAFARNLIRRDILPPMRTITQNLELVFNKNSRNFWQIKNFLDSELCARVNLNDRKLSLKKFHALHPALQSHFLFLLAKTGASSADIADCSKWLRGNPRGKSQKKLGDSLLRIQNSEILW